MNSIYRASRLLNQIVLGTVLDVMKGWAKVSLGKNYPYGFLPMAGETLSKGHRVAVRIVHLDVVTRAVLLKLADATASGLCPHQRLAQGQSA